MEILNNIWSALTTENEMLMSLILIPFNLIENYISLTLFSTILKIECNKRQKLIYIIWRVSHHEMPSFRLVIINCYLLIS